MPFHNPIPGRENNDKLSKGMRSGLQSVVQVEKISQIAFILPVAVLIGWLGGAWLDQHFHQSWMTLTGFILGSIAGMTSAIKLALSMVNEPKNGKTRPQSTQNKDSD